MDRRCDIPGHWKSILVLVGVVCEEESAPNDVSEDFRCWTFEDFWHWHNPTVGSLSLSLARPVDPIWWVPPVLFQGIFSGARQSTL